MITEKRNSINNVLKMATSLLIGLGSFMFMLPSLAHAAEDDKVLTVYFSLSGNTRAIATQIHEKVGGDFVELKSSNTYPAEHKATTEQAKRELQNDFRPPLIGEIANMDSYDVIFIGYPNWWGTFPTIVFSFLEKYDLSGKTLVPFVTHGGSRFGTSVQDMKQLAPQATLLEGLAIRDSQISNAEGDLDKWLKQINMIK